MPELFEFLFSLDASRPAHILRQQMAPNGRKRSHDDYASDEMRGVGETITRLRRASNEDQHADQGHGEADDAGGWQQAESHSSKKRKKIPKKESNNYPTISHSSHNRLQSFVKVGDLQNLVLYLLADGVAPQWCSVKNPGQIRKVVTLMVPGLEAGMFDGSIPLSTSQDLDQDQQYQQNGTNGTTPADSSKLAQQNSNVQESQPLPDSLSTSAPPQRTKISPDDYYPVRLKKDRLPAPLQPLSEMFEHIWPVKCPGDDRYARMHSPMASILVAPLVKSKDEKKGKGPQPPPEGKNWKNQRAHVTDFLASKEELDEEGYVLHPALYNSTSAQATEEKKREVNNQTTAVGWVDTPGIPDLAAGLIQNYWPSGAEKVLAMDCEMCITSPVGTVPPVFSLTRISIVDWDGKVVMDEYVKPDDPITDYVTPYSGITAEKLADVTTTLADIQKKLQSEVLTPYTILLGHSLNSDLAALRITHPWIIDTALLFPHPRGPPLKQGLKFLAQKYLSREIQRGHGSTGHDSIEDARACLDLVKQKCEKGKAWGTSEASGESIFKRLARSHRPRKHKRNAVGDDEPRTGAVVDWGDPQRGYGGAAALAIGCESDEQVVEGITRAISGSELVQDPTAGVDFTFARLRELEAHRGWWNRSKTSDNAALLSTTTSSTSTNSLAAVTSQTISRTQEIWNALPPCTAFIVFSGCGDPRRLAELQEMQKRFKEEYKVKKWDELSVKWTDVEEQEMRSACERARRGVGFVGVK